MVYQVDMGLNFALLSFGQWHLPFLYEVQISGFFTFLIYRVPLPFCKFVHELEQFTDLFDDKCLHEGEFVDQLGLELGFIYLEFLQNGLIWGIGEGSEMWVFDTLDRGRPGYLVSQGDLSKWGSSLHFSKELGVFEGVEFYNLRGFRVENFQILFHPLPFGNLLLWSEGVFWHIIFFKVFVSGKVLALLPDVDATF